ncbi:MAG: phosphoribosyltransferase [Flavobacteriaceae bacterium]|nr:phosphoribosyltransferase [Flavobacteriaceae bacterium]|tara:strand:- start:236482 stop:236985 length:504 start_codon:yes stop_codon:yes gene_type:complete
MTLDKNIILNNEQIVRKIRRIAFQIYETNSNEAEVVIAGIKGNGYLFAEKLVKELQKISPIKVTICEVQIDKKNPLSEVTTSIETSAYQDKSVVLVDDVLYTGTTLIYGVKHFLQVPLKQFKTAVLVDRNFKKYPVKADFKGISLSTSILEHVDVEFSESGSKAFLV